jgi:hypothetical protein
VRSHPGDDAVALVSVRGDGGDRRQDGLVAHGPTRGATVRVRR